MIYLITYDLRNGEKDYSNFYSTIKNFPKFCNKNNENILNLKKIEAKINIKCHSKITRLITKGFSQEAEKIFNDDYTYDDFVYDFINNPQEYIRQAENLKYGEFNFNLATVPQFCTFDYLDISSDNFDQIEQNNCGCETEQEVSDREKRQPIKTLTLNSESRLLYNEKEDEWNSEDVDLQDNFYKVKKTKINFNDNIKKGKWFQLPPGWSLIDVSPILEEKDWGSKRWLDARPFYWGTINDNERNNFNEIYKTTIKIFIQNFYQMKKNMLLVQIQVEQIQYLEQQIQTVIQMTQIMLFLVMMMQLEVSK